MNKMIVSIKGGQIVASVSTDPDYPGIDLEFVPDVENLEALSRFRVLMEQPLDSDCVRALIWNDENSEDYSDEFEVPIKEQLPINEDRY